MLPEPLQDGSRRMWVTLRYLGSVGSTVRKSCWASWKAVTPARISMVFMVARRLVSTSKAKILLQTEPKRAVNIPPQAPGTSQLRELP